MSGVDTRAAEAEALVWSACSALVDTALTLLAADPGLARFDLATAAVCGEADVVERLVGADPGARVNGFFTPLGRTPLHYATFSRLGRVLPERREGLRAVVRVLLDLGADPNLAFHHAGWVQAPIFGAAGIAGDPELTAMLIEAGADADDAGSEREVGEALLHAAEWADPACVEALLAAGVREAGVAAALRRALDFDHPEVVLAFCAGGARPDAEHLLAAVWRRRGARVVAALLEAGAPADVVDGRFGISAMEIARRWGDTEVAEVLAGAGAGGADTGLALAPEAEQALLDRLLVLAVERGSLTDVRAMLEAGARVDGDPEVREVPLAQACWRGADRIVAELLTRGASTEFPNGLDAIGATRHGAGHCNDPQGGGTMATAQEIDRAPYARIEALLAAAGAL